MTYTAPPVLICPICGNAVIMNGVGVGGQLLHWECTKPRYGLPVSIAHVGWRCPSCSTIHAPSVKACHCKTRRWWQHDPARASNAAIAVGV